MSNLPIVVQGKVETPTGFIELRSQDWLNWLAQNSSFRYEPQEYPGFTVRLEKKRYWVGYRKVAGELRKEYIGKPENLTTERLEEIAKQLEEPSQPRPKKVTENQVSVTPLEDYVTQYVTREDFEQLRSEFESLRSELEQLHSESKNPVESTATATGIEVQNGFFQEEDESTVASNEEIQQLRTQVTELHTQVADLETRLKLAHQQKKELEQDLARVERENQELHARLGNQPPSTLPRLEELESVRDRVLGNWRVKKGAESKDRLKQALDKFIEQLLPGLPNKLPNKLPNEQWKVGDKVSVKMPSGVTIPSMEIRSIQHKYGSCKVYDPTTNSHFSADLADLAPPLSKK